MVALSIKSLQHPIVKELVKLRKNPADSDDALISGQKMIKELGARFPLKHLILESSLNPAHFPQAEHTYFVTEPIIKKITGLPSTDGACATLQKPPCADLSKKKRLLALDRISDPGNLGTLLRTALALGYEGAYLIEGVHPYNDKALRAAKGATFHLPLQRGSTQDFIQFLKQGKITGILASLEGPSLSSFKVQEPFVIVLGNEAQGANPEISKCCQAVTIPMSENSESLNVAVAGGIILYALVR